MGQCFKELNRMARRMGLKITYTCLPAKARTRNNFRKIITAAQILKRAGINATTYDDVQRYIGTPDMQYSQIFMKLSKMSTVKLRQMREEVVKKIAQNERLIKKIEERRRNEPEGKGRTVIYLNKLDATRDRLTLKIVKLRRETNNYHLTRNVIDEILKRREELDRETKKGTEEWEIPARITEKIKDIDMEILELKRKGYSPLQIAGMLKISPSKIYYRIGKLVELGCISPAT